MDRRQEVLRRAEEILGKKPGSLAPEMEIQDIVADSFALVEVVIRLQEETGVILMQEDLRKVRTVGDLLDSFVQRTEVARRPA